MDEKTTDRRSEEYESPSKRCRGKQMGAGIVGIAVVVAIGLIWSVAVMSELVPVDGSAATSPHVGDQALLIR